MLFLWNRSNTSNLRRLKIKDDKLKRSNKITLLLNNRELRALNVYCNRYRVANKSRFLRETIMTAILKRFDEEMPTLWEDSDPDLFNGGKP